VLEKAALRKRLVDDFDCDEGQVDGVVEEVMALAPHIATAFEEWFNTDVVNELEVEGYNVSSVCNKQQMNIVGAYLTLDWLHREPKEAKRALEAVEIKNSAILRYER